MDYTNFLKTTVSQQKQGSHFLRFVPGMQSQTKNKRTPSECRKRRSGRSTVYFSGSDNCRRRQR